MELPPLVCRSVTRRFEDRVAVDDLSFTVGRGEILGLVGPNGAGKTTTLRTIAGVLPIQEGRVVIDGHDVAAEEMRAKARLAYVPDDPAPFDVLTVGEHLEFTARLFRVDGWKEKAERLLERFELADRVDALGSELSRGMRQKLSFCTAWLSSPAVCLLDEPLSGLDPRGIRSARAAIQELRDSGAAIVLSSHLLELIEALADRILIIDQGAKVFEGTLEDARSSVALTEGDSLEEIFFAATGKGVEESVDPTQHGAEDRSDVPTDPDSGGGHA
ncbi:MAG: ABC transporter ATP-binding protein [Planctomycetota bacterium]